MSVSIHRAKPEDIPYIEEIYMLIHRYEAAGKLSIGWNPDVYPTRKTAEKALAENALFVMYMDNKVVASAIINHEQPEAYASIDWQYPADKSALGVLHTLVVHPDINSHGLGRRFISFFEDYCRNNGCEVVRLDTQEKNIRAFNLYPRLGYRLAGIRDTEFQHLPQLVHLAMFEKRL